MTSAKPTFTLRDASDYLQLSEATVERLANQGFVEGHKIGRRWRFSGRVIREMAQNPGFLRRITFKS